MKFFLLLLCMGIEGSAFALSDSPCKDLKPIAIAWAQGTVGLDSIQFDKEYKLKDCQARSGYFPDEEQPYGFSFESVNQTCVVSVVIGTLRIGETNCFKN